MGKLALYELTCFEYSSFKKEGFLLILEYLFPTIYLQVNEYLIHFIAMSYSYQTMILVC